MLHFLSTSRLLLISIKQRPKPVCFDAAFVNFFSLLRILTAFFHFSRKPGTSKQKGPGCASAQPGPLSVLVSGVQTDLPGSAALHSVRPRMFNLGRAEVSETSNVSEPPGNLMQRPSRYRNILQRSALSDGPYIPAAMPWHSWQLVSFQASPMSTGWRNSNPSRLLSFTVSPSPWAIIRWQALQSCVMALPSAL